MTDLFKSERIPSTYTWEFSPKGQHIELGIAEMNLFILLSALGLSHSLFGERLLPIGTLYDPFIAARPRCAELCLLPGCALHPGGDAVGRDAGAGRRRAPVDRHAADRHGAGRARRLRAGLRRRARRSSCAGPSTICSASGDAARRRNERTWLRDETGGSVYLRLSTRSDRAAAARDDAGAARRTSSTAPIGCASPGRTRRSSSPIPARSRRRRSRPSA